MLFFAVVFVLAGVDLIINDGQTGAGILAIITGAAIFFIPDDKYKIWEQSSREKKKQKEIHKVKKGIEREIRHEQYITNKNTTLCPRCQSTNIHFLGNNRKGFSVGKAVGGAVLTGGIGTLAGFAGKKGKKDTWHCKNCGELFEMKTR